MLILISRLIKQPKLIGDTRDIFFNTSIRKSFSNEREKINFSYKYFDYYLEQFPDLFFIYTLDDQVIGYICGADKLEPQLFKLQPHMQVFSDYFEQYPAHLHINFSAKARGKGLGSILLNHFTSSLGQAGVHIITGPMERNVFFYEKNGFSFKQEKTYYDTRLLFMGKSLS